MKRIRTRIDRDLLDAVRERAAAEEDRSEEELIEEAVRRYLFIPPHDRREEGRRPWPRYPLYGSGGPTLAERVDDKLAGGPGSPPFGEH
jgi:Ribbon-helix-helix protein, copG family